MTLLEENTNTGESLEQTVQRQEKRIASLERMIRSLTTSRASGSSGSAPKKPRGVSRALLLKGVAAGAAGWRCEVPEPSIFQRRAPIAAMTNLSRTARTIGLASSIPAHSGVALACLAAMLASRERRQRPTFPPRAPELALDLAVSTAMV